MLGGAFLQQFLAEDGEQAAFAKFACIVTQCDIFTVETERGTRLQAGAAVTEMEAVAEMNTKREEKQEYVVELRH